MTASVAEWLWFLGPDDNADANSSWRQARAGDAPVDHTPDEAVARIRAGDTHVFTDVYVTYADRLSTYARGYVRDASVANDLAHDVLASVWEGRDRLRVRGTLAAYLYGAVRLAALTWMRDTKVRERYLSAVASEDAHRAVTSPDAEDPERLREERRAIILRAVDDLPERCREAFLLRWRDALSYAEIAAVMGISLKTVEMQMTIAVKRLRVRLGT